MSKVTPFTNSIIGLLGVKEMKGLKKSWKTLVFLDFEKTEELGVRGEGLVCLEVG